MCVCLFVRRNVKTKSEEITAADELECFSFFWPALHSRLIIQPRVAVRDVCLYRVKKSADASGG